MPMITWRVHKMNPSKQSENFTGLLPVPNLPLTSNWSEFSWCIISNIQMNRIHDDKCNKCDSSPNTGNCKRELLSCNQHNLNWKKYGSLTLSVNWFGRCKLDWCSIIREETTDIKLDHPIAFLSNIICTWNHSLRFFSMNFELLNIAWGCHILSYTCTIQ